MLQAKAGVTDTGHYVTPLSFNETRRFSDLLRHAENFTQFEVVKNRRR